MTTDCSYNFHRRFLSAPFPYISSEVCITKGVRFFHFGHTCIDNCNINNLHFQLNIQSIQFISATYIFTMNNSSKPLPWNTNSRNNNAWNDPLKSTFNNPSKSTSSNHGAIHKKTNSSSNSTKNSTQPSGSIKHLSNRLSKVNVLSNSALFKETSANSNTNSTRLNNSASHKNNTKPSPSNQSTKEAPVIPSLKVFLGNLGPEVTEEMINRILQPVYPTIQPSMTRVVRDKNSGESRFGFVVFGDGREGLKFIREWQNKFLGSRPLQLQRSKQ